jgi:hypothetical protein
MAATPETAVAALLREAEAAHGEYETTVLSGVYDEDWPRWYATHLLDHGLAEHLPGEGSLDVDHLAARLKRLADEFEREQPSDPWPQVYARRLVAGDGVLVTRD